MLKSMTDKALRPYGYDDVSNLAWSKIASAHQQRTVVVIGEVGRGKSALANALVGVKDASPAGVDFTTTTAVGLSTQNLELPPGQVKLLYSDGSKIVDHAQLASWISRANQKSLLEKGEFAPTRALVSLHHSELNDVVVVDTPGVGGIDPDSSKLVHSNAQSASVLVVAVDASSPLTRPEMELIRNTGAEIDSVIVVVTKIDKNFTRWQQIVAENKKLLKQFTGRTIPVIGVSSFLATYNPENATEQEIKDLRDASGINTLRNSIQQCFKNAQYIPALNALRIGIEGLKRLNKQLAVSINASENGIEAIPELTSKLEDLERLKQETERWEQYLQRDLTNARQSALHSLEIRLDTIRENWTSKINKQGMRVLRKDPQYFTAEMEKDFLSAVTETVNEFTDQLKNQVIGDRFKSEHAWAEIEQQLSEVLTSQNLHTVSVRKKTEGLFDPMMLMMGLSGGNLIGGVLLGAASITGAGLAIGASWVAFNVGFRAMRSGKSNLINWLRETVNTAKVFTSRLLDTAIAGARPIIVINYRDQLKAQIQSTQKNINEAKQAAKMDATQRNRKIEQTRKNITIINKKISQAETLISEISSLGVCTLES